MDKVRYFTLLATNHRHSFEVHQQRHLFENQFHLVRLQCKQMTQYNALLKVVRTWKKFSQVFLLNVLPQTMLATK
jgi:hypothetical protein